MKRVLRFIFPEFQILQLIAGGALSALRKSATARTQDDRSHAGSAKTNIAEASVVHGNRPRTLDV
jgi:hypothetical protein